jgi:hypothetical protein
MSLLLEAVYKAIIPALPLSVAIPFPKLMEHFFIPPYLEMGGESEKSDSGSTPCSFARIKSKSPPLNVSLISYEVVA